MPYSYILVLKQGNEKWVTIYFPLPQIYVKYLPVQTLRKNCEDTPV